MLTETVQTPLTNHESFHDLFFSHPVGHDSFPSPGLGSETKGARPAFSRKRQEPMEDPNALSFECDWRAGFNLRADQKPTVGYLLFLAGCGGLNLAKDIK